MGRGEAHGAREAQSSGGRCKLGPPVWVPVPVWVSVSVPVHRDISRGWKNGLTSGGRFDSEKKVFDLRADEVTSPGDFEVWSLSCG